MHNGSVFIYFLDNSAIQVCTATRSSVAHCIRFSYTDQHC